MDSFATEQSNQQINSESTEEDKEFADMTLSDFIEKKMLPRALQCDIKMDEFFDYTLKEVKIVIRAFMEKQQDDLRLQSQMDYLQCNTLAGMIGCMFSKDAKVPRYEDVYSFLYDATELNEIQEKKEEAKREAEMKRIQASMLAMAHSFNAKFEKKSDKPTGEVGD